MSDLLLGTVLLLLALMGLVGAFAAALMDLIAKDAAKRRLAVRATWTAQGFLTLALLLLAGAFLAGDLTLAYVWANTDLRYAWYQRLSGLWVGRAGSLLLWTVLTLTFWSLEELRHHVALRRSEQVAVESAETANGPRRNRGTDDLDTRLERAERVRAVARPAMLLLVLLMLTVVVLDDPFAPVDPDLARSEPWGRGVNPQLIIPLNAIHPPIVFIAYGLTALPTAFALGHLVTGHDAWLGPARRWAHLAFFFLTLGVGLGALWAYIALGWGGYWAWDPVEVGSVVPWLIITAFLHAAYRADGKGQFPVAAPAFGFLALAGSVFSTFVVRAGGVWVSLHSFLGPGASNDPWQRFLNAFADQPEVKLYTTLLVAMILGVVVLVARHVQRLERAEDERLGSRDPAGKDATAQKDAEREDAKKQHAAPAGAGDGAQGGMRAQLDRLLSYVTLSNVFVVGVLLLALLATVTITVLLMGVNGFPSDRVRAEVFTERTAPIALTAVLVMALAVSIGVLHKTHVLALLGGALLVGGLAALVFPANWALAMAVPVLVAAAVLVGTRIVLAWKTLVRKQAIRFTGIHLVHLGIALLFLGHGFVSAFQDVHPRAELDVGETQEVGPYLVQLVSLDATDTDDNGRLDHVVARMQVWEDGSDLGMVTAGFQYYDFQSHYKPDVGLAKKATKDVYFAPIGLHDPDQGWLFGNLPLGEQGAFEAASIDGFAVEVSTLPYIDLVWTGTLLMVLGAALLSFASWTAWRPTRVSERRPAGTTSPA